MTVSILSGKLKEDLQVFHGLLDGLDINCMRWKPAGDDGDRWSILEVLAHLLDEEKEDFRQELKNLTVDPAIDWPDIAPGAWVTERGYNQYEPSVTLTDFHRERKRSLAWLTEHADLDPEIEHTGSHPFHRSLKAGDIMASWIAHDYFHIRQITNLKWEYLMKSAAPYECWYAGEY